MTSLEELLEMNERTRDELWQMRGFTEATSSHLPLMDDSKLCSSDCIILPHFQNEFLMLRKSFGKAVKSRLRQMIRPFSSHTKYGGTSSLQSNPKGSAKVHIKWSFDPNICFCGILYAAQSSSRTDFSFPQFNIIYNANSPDDESNSSCDGLVKFTTDECWGVRRDNI